MYLDAQGEKSKDLQKTLNYICERCLQQTETILVLWRFSKQNMAISVKI